MALHTVMYVHVHGYLLLLQPSLFFFSSFPFFLSLNTNNTTVRYVPKKLFLILNLNSTN